jgi:hypothetical protein
MEPDQIDVLALAVLCSLEEIDDALEAGLLSQAWSDIRETDREDRIHLDRALSHAVDTASLEVIAPLQTPSRRRLVNTTSRVYAGVAEWRPGAGSSASGGIACSQLVRLESERQR